MKQEYAQIMDQIRAFYDTTRNKVLIDKYLYESFFDVIGKNRSESTHTNFLKWFFSQPEWNENALRCFLKLIIKNVENVKNINLIDSEKEYLASIDWDNCETCLWGDNPLQTEYPCVCKVNEKKQIVRVDLVMNLKVRSDGEKDRHLKIVLENKIDSQQTNDQTWKYYVYFSNDDSECCSKEPDKTSITAYKKVSKRYKPKNEDEIQIFVLLSPNNEVETKSSRGICDKYVRITYQEVYDYVFKEIERNLSKKVDKRKQYYLALYMHNLTSPVLITDKYKPIMAFMKEDVEALKAFFYENLPLFNMAAEAIVKYSANAEEIETVSNIRRNIQALNRRSDYYNLCMPDYDVYEGLLMKEVAQKVVSYLLNSGQEVNVVKNLLPGPRCLQTTEEFQEGKRKSEDIKYEDRRNLICGKFYLSNQWTAPKFSYFLKKLDEAFPEIHISLQVEE